MVSGLGEPSHLERMRSVTLISAIGLPAVSMPAGFDPATRLPVALQLIAGPG